MRKRAERPISSLFIAGLALLLAVLLPALPKAENVDRIVAIINDGIITLSELNAALNLAMERIEGFNKNDAGKAAELKTKILDSLIEQKLVKQASDKAGIEISEREIDNAVDDIKKQNNLTHESLLLALAQSGLTYREYREQLKEQIRQVKFINKEFRSKVSVLPEDIEDYYRQNMTDFYGPPSFRLNMIFIPETDKEIAKIKIKTVQEGLAKGEDFRDLASHYSEGPGASLGGDVGYLKSGEMDKAIEAAALGLKGGEISGPIVTPDGVYFIQLVDAKPAAPRSL
ncbi:MAG: SurA N-terminal domain-containing protein, partial [Deltaproteobacteria bacterium]|nr:SurA N-terminal domain-containing protein [Deltaproteobacteria bacterium]